jgi:3-oxoacyl-[acyl-carrier protein] reductase/7-alpha-hydroxysteroid dehydrogenase
MRQLEGKVAVVTGGTRGIGLAIVKAFLQEGASVALFGSRQETVDKALAEIQAADKDAKVIGLAPDLANYEAVKSAMDTVKKAFGKIDILANNAGVSAREPIYD